MKAFFSRFMVDEQGQDLVEYGLLIGIITLAAVGFITTLGGKISGYFSSLNSKLP